MRMGPTLGQHTREILRELGYNDKAIDRFKATGVTISAKPGARALRAQDRPLALEGLGRVRF